MNVGCWIGQNSLCTLASIWVDLGIERSTLATAPRGVLVLDIRRRSKHGRGLGWVVGVFRVAVEAVFYVEGADRLLQRGDVRRPGLEEGGRRWVPAPLFLALAEFAEV
jgi:hypothetical protein